MFIYHLCFGLSQLGYLNASFSTELFWLLFRAFIIFLFLSLVGIGLYLSTRNKVFSLNYFKRMGLLAFYFSLISLLSYLVRPDFYVYFGILHLIFVASILGLAFLKLRWSNLVLGIFILILGFNYTSTTFNEPSLIWLGLSNWHPNSDDFAPVIPWFGFVLIGIFIAKQIFEENNLNLVNHWKARNLLSKLICWAGRQSIHLYFIHFQLFYIMVFYFG